MKSLAIFVEHLYGGGVEKVLQSILRYMDRTRYSLTLYSIREEILRDDIYPQDVEYVSLFAVVDEQDSFWVTSVKKIKNKIRLFVYYHFRPEVFYKLFVRKRYDVFIAFIEGYATRIVSGAPSNLRKIAWIHTDLLKNHWTSVSFRSFVEEMQCYQKFDKVVCVSRLIKEIMDSTYGLREKTTLIYNPIDRGEIRQLALQGLPEKYKKSDRLRLVTVGSLIPIKGYDRLLHCIWSLRNAGYNLELYMVGDGCLKKSLLTYIDESGLKDVVVLTGFLDNPYPLIASADIYVCSSIAEGLNTAISEALILGIPVISTNCSGTAELLGDSQFGLVVPNEKEGLLNGLRKLLDEPGLRKKLSVSAYERGLAFSIEKPMECICQLLG